jgi:RND family efflux transporter MFP subunit
MLICKLGIPMVTRSVLTVTAVMLATLLGACQERPEPAPSAQVTPSSERLVVQTQTVSDLKPVFATLTSRNQGLAIARISGTLISLSVKEGDQVRKGQVIARIKDDRLNLQAQAYDAQVAAAEAEAARAQADLGRIRTLYDSGIYAKARLEQSEAAAKAAAANLKAARAQAGASAELANQGAVLAPADGKVLHAAVPIGTAVMAGQTIAEVTAGPLVVRLELPEGQAASLKLGDRVALEAANAGGTVRQGTIIEIYPSITNGQMTADLQVAGLASDRIGQRIRAHIQVGQRPAITVPKRFIMSRYGIDFVRLVQANNQTSDVSVQTAPYGAGDAVEILSGLRAGDVIVAAGAAQ